MDQAKNVGDAKGHILSEQLNFAIAPPVPPPLHTNKALSLLVLLIFESLNLFMNQT